MFLEYTLQKSRLFFTYMLALFYMVFLLMPTSFAAPDSSFMLRANTATPSLGRRPFKVAVLDMLPDLQKMKALASYDDISFAALSKNEILAYVGASGVSSEQNSDQKLHSPWILAYQVEKKQQKWAFLLDAPMSAPPLVVQQEVYVATQKGSVFALEATSGKLLWKLEVGPFPNKKMLKRGTTLLVASAQQSVYAIDTSKGSLQWVYDAGNSTTLGLHSLEAMATDGHYLYYGTDNNVLHVVDWQTGKLFVKKDQQSNWAARFQDVSTMTVHKDTLFIGRYNGWVTALSLAPGKFLQVLWEQSLGSISTALLDEDVYYVATLQGNLLALEALTGRVLFKKDLAFSISSITLEEGLLWLTGYKGFIYILDAKNAEVIWHECLSTALAVAPLRIGSALWFPSAYKSFYAYALPASSPTVF